jgi:hypothetical protein
MNGIFIAKGTLKAGAWKPILEEEGTSLPLNPGPRASLEKRMRDR